MNILYDHQIFQSQKFGGISRYFDELIRRVAVSPEMSVSLFQGFHINRCCFEDVRGQFHRYFGVLRPEIPKTGRVFARLNGILFSRFAAAVRPDIHHLTYYGDPYPRFRGVRVLTVYDMIHELFPENFPGDPTSRQKRDAVARADRIIAISEATRQDLIRILGTPAEKIRVVHLANSLRSAPGHRVFSSPYILFVGTRGGYKNFAGALKAFAASSRLPREFHLISFGGPPFSADEIARIHSLKLGERVQHLSGSDDVLASLYQHASLFICPSRYEGFGLPVLEAMHYRCPVLCARTSSLPEVAGDAALYFDPNDSEAMTHAMETAAYDAEIREALAKAGPLREATFSWDRCAAETMACYRS